MENIRLRGTETCENDSFGDRWFVAGYMHLDVCFLGLSILSVVSMLVWKFLFPKRCANVFDHLQKYMDTKTDVPSDTTANVLQDIGERLHDAFMPEKRFVSAFLLYVGGKLALAVPLLLMQIFLITHCISPVRGELLPGSKDKLIYSHPMNFSWLTNVKEELLLAQSPKGYFPRDVYCNALPIPEWEAAGMGPGAGCTVFFGTAAVPLDNERCASGLLDVVRSSLDLRAAGLLGRGGNGRREATKRGRADLHTVTGFVLLAKVAVSEERLCDGGTSVVGIWTVQDGEGSKT
ncbi:hypothetical protein QR680_007295 [Steinernema hermaphroditum]|uniref:Uncharacterized protein n=1 Tax=Steinernema hermaphroditum TaxID=289476 RepID=A0AA39IE49_9BILA|nr:hypothetical protein QR680_007295 [Steinernema hermaphroditum]